MGSQGYSLCYCLEILKNPGNDPSVKKIVDADSRTETRKI